MIGLKIAEALMQNAADIPGPGFMHGKMGIALFFFHLGEFTQDEAYTVYASGLVDEVQNSLNKNCPVDFENGLAGIGWGFEYLFANRFVGIASGCNRDYVLTEIDSVLDTFFTWGKNTRETILSIAYYFISRLAGRETDETTGQVLNIKHKLILLLDDLEQIIFAEGGCAEIADVLHAYHRLNLYNHKVEKLQKAIGRYPVIYFMPFIPALAEKRMVEIANSDSGLWVQSWLENDRVAPHRKWGLAGGLAGIGLQLLKSGRLTGKTT